MTPRMIVTGCHGFVGRSVTRVALDCGWTVLGLGRASSGADLGRYRQCDVATTDLGEIVADFRPDVVVHAAGAASVEASFADPAADFRGSVSTWMNLLDGVRRSGTHPLVIGLSSAAVYGQPREFPVTESSPRRPMSPYGHHRLMCEALATEYADCFGVRCLVTRIFSVFGPGQRRLLAFELAAQALGQGEVVTVRGTGKESRDFLHVDDVARGLVGLAQARDGLAGVTVVNLASGVETTVREVAEVAVELAGLPKEIRYLGQEIRGNPQRWVADVSLLRALLPSWDPRPVRDTLAGCVDVWRSERHR